MPSGGWTPAATTCREQVVAYDPPRRFGYELLEGMPVHDYRAEVTLEPSDGGTDIRWHSTFRPQWPGTGPLLRRKMRQVLTDTSEALARHTATSGGPAPD